jgi:hypothetical protein
MNLEGTFVPEAISYSTRRKFSFLTGLLTFFMSFRKRQVAIPGGIYLITNLN